MIALPAFDLLLSTGVGLVDLADNIDLDAAWLSPDTRAGLAQRRRLKASLVDLERLQAGWVPATADLLNTPLLQHWCCYGPGFASQTVLIGAVTAHPLLPDGRRVATSLLLALDIRGLRWARTVSRFYRLGEPGELGG